MKIKETFKCGFQLLHNFTARQEDYEILSGSTKYMLYYCAIHWVENKLLVGLMTEVWSNVIKLIKFWTTFPKTRNLHAKAIDIFVMRCKIIS